MPFQVIGAVVAVVASVAGGIYSYVSSSAAAEQAQEIAAYQAAVQRQNAEIAYKMAVYQANSAAAAAAVNQANSLANQQFALVQGVAARRQYEMGLVNAKVLEQYADNIRARGSEETSRKRQEYMRRLGSIRAKYGASGVAQEGSPLIVLADEARLGETAAQDAHYLADLESAKQYRAATMERYKAGFSLIDEFGAKVQAQISGNQAAKFAWDKDLYFYDSEIAATRKRLANYEANITAMGGAAEASGLRARGISGLISGAASAGSAVAGIGQIA